MRYALGFIILVITLLALGCSGREEDDATARALASGSDRIESREGRVWLELSDAGQLVVFERLAKEGGFALDLRELRPRRLTLRLEDASFAEAVAAIVGETAYRLSYAFDPEIGTHRLVEVQVGEGEPTRAALERRAGAGRVTPDLSTSSEPRAEGDVAAVDAGVRGESSRDRIDRAREQAADLRDSVRRANGEERHQLVRDYERAQDALQEQLRLALRDPDPMVRAEALEEVETDQGDARQRIGTLARDDPDPRIQKAAIELLGDDGTFEAVSQLVTMLDASEPDVLLATLEALDLTGDESLAPRIEPLADHADAEVRAKATEMLEYWE